MAEGGKLLTNKERDETDKQTQNYDNPTKKINKKKDWQNVKIERRSAI